MPFPLDWLPFPHSSVQFGIYHLGGVIFFVQGDYQNALKQFQLCSKWSRTYYDWGDDNWMVCNNWLWITYQRIGTPQALGKAKLLLQDIHTDQSKYKFYSTLANYNSLLLYKGVKTPRGLLKSSGLDFVIQGYAVANYLVFQQKERYHGERVLEMVIGTHFSSSFPWSESFTIPLIVAENDQFHSLPAMISRGICYLSQNGTDEEDCGSTLHK